MATTNEKIARLRAAMLAAGVHACLIPSSDPHISEYLPDHWAARRYFSGFTGSVGTLVVTETASALWVDGRYFVQAENQLAGTEISLQKMRLPGVPTVTEYLARALGKGQVLALDGQVTPTAQVLELQKALAAKGASVKDLDLAGPNWPGRPALPATPCYILGKEYAGYTAAEKLDQLREKLSARGADAMVVSSLDSVAWLLNLRAADLECTPFALAWCFVTLASAVLFIDGSRVDGAVRACLKDNGVELRGYDELPAYLAGYTARQAVLADPAALNWALWSTLHQNPAFTVQEGADPIQAMKGVKNETEISCLRNSHIKDGVAMVRFQMELEARLAAGETVMEPDVEQMLIRQRSSQEHYLMESFGAIAAWGPNAAMMHYHATPEQCSRIERRGFLLVDCGGQYLDGTTDITRTYALGELTDEEKFYYTLVLKSHANMARAVFMEGCTGGNLDIVARGPVWRHGLDYRCGTGHGVGFVGGVHEGPQSLRINNNVAFVPGMTITDEPGIYETDQLGIRIENELLCVPYKETEYGKFYAFEPITYCPIDTQPVLVELLNEEELAWLNAYHQTVYDTLAPRLTEQEQAWLRAKTAPLSK